MRINIKATKIKLTPEVKDYIQEKIDMLGKYLGNLQIINTSFEIEKTTQHHLKGRIYRAEVNLVVAGDLLRVEKTEKDIYKAIDKVKDHLEMIIKKYKEKKIERRRK